MPVSATSTEVRVFLSFSAVRSKSVYSQATNRDGKHVSSLPIQFRAAWAYFRRRVSHACCSLPLPFTKRTEVGITQVEGLQGIIRECPVIAVDNAPIVGTLRLAICGFKSSVTPPERGSSSRNNPHRHHGTVRQESSFLPLHTSCHPVSRR